MNFLKFILLMMGSLTSLDAQSLTIKNELSMSYCNNASTVLSMSKYGGINRSQADKLPYLLLCDDRKLIINGKPIHQLSAPVYLEIRNFVSSNIQGDQQSISTPVKEKRINNQEFDSLAIPIINPINIRIYLNNLIHPQECITVLRNKFKQLTNAQLNTCDNIVNKLDWLVAWGLAGGRKNVENALKRANKALQDKNTSLTLTINDLSSVIVSKSKQKTLYFTKLWHKKRWDIWIPPLDKNIEIKTIIPKV